MRTFAGGLLSATKVSQDQSQVTRHKEIVELHIEMETLVPLQVA